MQKGLNKPIELADRLADIDKSVIEYTHKQKELNDLAVRSLTGDTDINPAAFEKSQNERIAESNAVFKNIYNKGMEPHITILFENISNYTNINQLFVEEGTGNISNMVLIIYRSSPTFGHWCCLTRSNDLSTITYFNSYGSYIDKSIDYIPEDFAAMSKQNFPYLLKLLSECNYKVKWNDKQLQARDNKSVTCGHWCGLFMRHNRFGGNLESFVYPFLSVPLEERDEMVLKITRPYLMA